MREFLNQLSFMNPVHNPAVRDVTIPVAANAFGDQTDVIKVIEEQIQVDKQVVETGRVVVSKVVHEEEQIVTTSPMHEEISMERVPMNQYVEMPPAIRYEGDMTIIPVVKEVVVTEKRLMLVEEIRITKRRITTDDIQRVMLRREEVTVQRVDNEDGRSV